MKKKDQDLEKIQQDFNELQARFTEMENQLKRAVADYQNLEKRITEGRSELTNWGTGNLILQILPVLDHLSKALAGMSDTDRESGWAKGVELAVKELSEMLKSEGLEEIVADGQFDPALHEAVDTKDGEDNTILEVVQKGYNLNGKVLRPAKVVVGRKI